MRELSPQQYTAKGQELGVDSRTLKNAVDAISRIQAIDPRIFPLLTLNHLSIASGVSYGYLRNAVARKLFTYRHFYMKKRQPGRKTVRMISVPNERILICQKWISNNILQFARAHSNSYAYHPKSNPVFAARVHSNAVWLIKVDIRDFFHAISEHRVYAKFRSIGFSRLLSLELARLCTMPVEPAAALRDPSTRYSTTAIGYYRTPYRGILPQGAPTSPMLSNLVMRELDAKLAQIAASCGMRFSRYADDIVFSCDDDRGRVAVARVKREILKVLNEDGFRPNLRKTVIRGPGSRKVVLGLLVDTVHLRLPKEFKDILRMHLHYLTDSKFGPAHHASARKTSVSRIYHHVFGLICWARAVEPSYGNSMLTRFNSIVWPPIAKPTY